MRYGYYLAAHHLPTGEKPGCKGDRLLSTVARILWDKYGTPEHGYHNTGVSVWYENDILYVRMVVADFFSTVPKVIVIRKSRKIPSINGNENDS